MVGGLIEDVTGTLDDAAGSTDESVSRQFDDTQGGGFLDPEGEPGDGVSDDPSMRDDAADVAGESIRSSFADLLSPFAQPATQPRPGENDAPDSGSDWDPYGGVPEFNPDDLTPAWLEWVMNHQEEVLIGLVILVVLASTNGTLDLDPRGGA